MNLKLISTFALIKSATSCARKYK